MSDDRESLGRLVRETWVACVVDYFKDPKLSWIAPWDDLDDFQREADMRIGSAVSARAVEDAKLRNDRLEAQVFALGANAPAIRRALVIAINGEEYEAGKRDFRKALEMMGGGEGQERSDEKERS